MFAKRSFVNYRMLCTVSLLVSCLLLVVPGCANAADAWFLKQVRFGEPLEVTIAANDLKVSMPMRGWSAVTSAPDWKVRTFNTKSKLYFDTTFEQWLDLSALDRIVDQRAAYDKAKELKVLSSGSYGQGFSSRRKIIFKSLGEKVGGPTWFGVSTVRSKMDVEEEKKYPVKSYSCLYAPNLGSEKINSFLYNLCYIPPAKGVPIRYALNLVDGRFSLFLSTSSLTAIKVDKTTFAVPTGFAKATSAREVGVGTDRKGVETILNDLDFGRPFGTDADKAPIKH